MAARTALKRRACARARDWRYIYFSRACALARELFFILLLRVDGIRSRGDPSRSCVCEGGKGGGGDLMMTFERARESHSPISHEKFCACC